MTVKELRALLPPDAAPRMDRFETGLDEYRLAFEPLFEWSVYQKIVRSAAREPRITTRSKQERTPRIWSR
ncbi:MAG TPA: hypothetical protein VF883_25300 [Thermoanaerobaculia bacterium]